MSSRLTVAIAITFAVVILTALSVWVLRDVGSTNGTYVNNRRVDRHELVDNDFIKFGSAMCKFKSL